jgi:hypothetical protein
VSVWLFLPGQNDGLSVAASIGAWVSFIELISTPPSVYWKPISEFMQVNRDAFRILPYLAFDDLGERVVNLMPLWDGNEWHHWLPHEGRIIKMQMFGVVVGEYLAKQPEASTDLSISFLEFAWQRASWPELCGLWRHLTDDIHNFAASVAKLEHFVAHREVIGLGVSAFVQTELEYLLVLARSVFDLLQELVSLVWTKRVRLRDPALEAVRKRHRLPPEFSKVVLRDKCEVRSAKEIAARFPVSPTLAGAYASAGAFFSRLRGVRDAIVHSGKGIDLILMSESGPCIHRTTPIMAELGLRAVPDAENENIVSLWPLVACVVFGTIDACDAIVESLARDVLFPPALAPGYSVFLRGFHHQGLLRLKSKHIVDALPSHVVPPSSKSI